MLLSETGAYIKERIMDILTANEQKILRILLQRPIPSSHWTVGEKRIIRSLARKNLIVFRDKDSTWASIWALENKIYE